MGMVTTFRSQAECAAIRAFVTPYLEAALAHVGPQLSPDMSPDRRTFNELVAVFDYLVEGAHTDDGNLVFEALGAVLGRLAFGHGPEQAAWAMQSLTDGLSIGRAQVEAALEPVGRA